MSGYPSPQYTMTPNALFDIDMRDMSETELKVTLAVIRQTLGYHKQSPEPLSYTDLIELTGMSRQGVRDGIKRALARGRIAIVTTGKRGVNKFVVNFDDQSTKQTSQQSRPETVYKIDQSEGAIKKEKEKGTPNGVKVSVVPPDETRDDDTSEQDQLQAKPTRARSPKQMELDAMVDALVAVFKLPRESIAKKRWDSLRGAGRQLLDTGAKPGDIPRLFHYVVIERGYKGSSEYALVKYWPDFKRDKMTPSDEPTASYGTTSNTAAMEQALSQSEAVA